MKPTDRKCEPRCGRGCTQAEYDRAVRLAADTAKVLGKGWTPHVDDNLGWYAWAVSPCGRIKVHASKSVMAVKGRIRNQPRTYTAYLGRADFPGGKWAEHAFSPRAAVRKVIGVALQYVAADAALVKDLPKFK